MKQGVVVEPDALRELVRAATEATSVQSLALRAGVSDETVYALLRGGKIGKGSRRLLEDAVGDPDRNSDGTVAPRPIPSTRADLGEPGTMSDGTPARLLPLHVLTYWRGRAEEQANNARTAAEISAGVARTTDALRAMLERATAGAFDFLESGVLPGITTDVTPTPEQVEAARRKYGIGDPPDAQTPRGDEASGASGAATGQRATGARRGA